MMQGTYYKEWSRVLGREMEFKVYGTAGCRFWRCPHGAAAFTTGRTMGCPMRWLPC